MQNRYFFLSPEAQVFPRINQAINESLQLHQTKQKVINSYGNES